MMTPNSRMRVQNAMSAAEYRRLVGLEPETPTAKPESRRKSPEADLQVACVEYLVRHVPPAPAGPWWSSINPIPAKSKAAAGRSKAMGMRAGVPDMLFLWRGQTLAIELKAKAGRLRPEQVQHAAEIEANGGRCFTARTLEEFAAILRDAGIPSTGRFLA